MILFENVSKEYAPNSFAVQNLSFEVKEGEILVLLGRSGSGKTTALRLINRLIEPTTGKILFKGKNLLDLDPIDLRRHIGYAIQHIGLFLHMTVGENVGIVPRLLGWNEKKIADRVGALLTMVGLEPETFRDVKPGKLSGGQKQRIGVARALAADPPVILMDEPFGALDPLMREQLQQEFLEIQSKIRRTIVFVTHDLSEAVKMGDRIAIFEEGKLLQIASPKELIESPANAFVDAFLGKDRFQLILQTQSLQEYITCLRPGKQKTHPQLSLNASLMETLTTFKITETEAVGVYNEQTYLGDLPRSEFLESLIRHV
ncbi:MAG: Osmoprotectant import ATP-binding protein OsmV [Chlamydiae bacterium]|nr:Osmoprotectant import ATP-binding protein OsmV [Chlamydiota bacterium]